MSYIAHRDDLPIHYNCNPASQITFIFGEKNEKTHFEQGLNFRLKVSVLMEHFFVLCLDDPGTVSPFCLQGRIRTVRDEINEFPPGDRVGNDVLL